MLKTKLAVLAKVPQVIRDYGAFKRKLKYGAAYEKREEPTLARLNETIDKIANIVEAMRKKNDERLDQLEKKGAADPITTEELKAMKDELATLKDTRAAIEDLRKKMGRPQTIPGKRDASPESLEHRKAMLGYLRAPNSRGAMERLEKAEKAAIEADKRLSEEFEARAVGTTSDGAGGYAVPELISRQILETLQEISPLRNLVTAISVGARDYKELVDRNGTTYGWAGETGARSETNTPTLAEIAPTFGLLYAYPKATEESLDDIFFDVEQWLVGAINTGFAAGEENAIVNGNGTNKPTGFLNGTPVATGDASRTWGVLQYIPTGVAADWLAADPGVDSPFDTFKQTIYQLKKGYRANARWLMNKATAGELMLMKDSENRYLWQQSLLEGQPDRLLGYPVSETEEMPDKAADAFPVAFGDFKAGYLLCDLVGFRLTRDEITTPGYVKWYARRRLGGKVRHSDAIKLIKIAAS